MADLGRGEEKVFIMGFRGVGEGDVCEGIAVAGGGQGILKGIEKYSRLIQHVFWLRT